MAAQRARPEKQSSGVKKHSKMENTDDEDPPTIKSVGNRGLRAL